MKLYSYIITKDTGLAPNPFWRYCTLSVCTPNHQSAQAGKEDWIMGTEDTASGNKLIYALEVDEKLHFDDYFKDNRFQKKKPVMNGTWRQRCGDNFYYSKTGKWKQLRNLYHYGESHLEKDTLYPYVFIGKHFFYFGKNAIEIPTQFKGLIWDRHGMKWRHNPDTAQSFLIWLRDDFKPGIHGEPRDKEKPSCTNFKSTPKCGTC